ncbi:hypothetical protein [Maricaulis sp. CAU 1757]
MNAELIERLKKALAGKAAVDIAQLQWIKLDMVKAEMGDQWIAVRKKIYQAAQNFIEKRLGPEDVIFPCRGGFIVILANLQGSEAAEQVELISQELNLFFLGDQILERLKMRAEVKTVAAKDLAGFVAGTTGASDRMGQVDEKAEGGDLANDALMAAVRWRPMEEGGSGSGQAPVYHETQQARAETAIPFASAQTRSAPPAGFRTAAERARSGTAPSPPAFPDDHQAKPAASRAVQPPEFEQKAQQAKPIAPGAGQNASNPSSSVQPPSFDHLSEKKAAAPSPPAFDRADARRGVSAEGGTAARHGQAAPQAATPDGAHYENPEAMWEDVVFKPVWDARNQLVTTNFVLARRHYQGQELFGADTLLGMGTPDLRRQLDYEVVVAAQRGFLESYSAGAKCAIAIPVDYATIVGVNDRVRYFSILQGVPQHLRKYFYLRVDNTPPGAPIWQMEELFRSMKCFGSNILAHVPVGTSRLSHFANCGVALIGSEFSCRKSGPTPQLLEDMTKQVEATKQLKAESYLTMMDSPRMLETAIGIGFRFFAGNLIGRDTARPQPLQSLGLAAIMKRAA